MALTPKDEMIAMQHNQAFVKTVRTRGSKDFRQADDKRLGSKKLSKSWKRFDKRQDHY